MGKKLADKANRAGVAERFPEPAVQQSIAVDLAVTDYDAQRLRDLAWAIDTTAKQPDANTLSLLQTVPGIGKLLSFVLLYARHDLARFPRVQAFVASCRLVKCAKASAGKRYGTSGTKSGNAYLTGAVSEAAGLFLRNHPAGQKLLARGEKNPARAKPCRSWPTSSRGRSMICSNGDGVRQGPVSP
jgi:transposase